MSEQHDTAHAPFTTNCGDFKFIVFLPILMVMAGGVLIGGKRLHAVEQRHDQAEAQALEEARLAEARIIEVEIDGCEYLTTFHGGITHKGNCANHETKCFEERRFVQGGRPD